MMLDYRTLTDRDLLAAAGHLAAHERNATADLIRALGEIDLRRLYLGEGFSSLFTFCTGALHLSEQAAYARNEAARLVRRFPMALDLLRDGSVNLTTLGLIAPHLTDENAPDVLAAIVHKSKREVEQIVAARAPKPAVPSVLRRVPTAAPVAAASVSESRLFADQAGAAPAPVPHEPIAASPPSAPRTVVAPLAPDRYKLQVTLSAAGYEALRSLQDLLRHTIPTGDPARIVERALVELLERVRRDKLGASAATRRGPRPSRSDSRHIPAAVRRRVWTVMAAAAHSSDRRAAAVSTPSSNSITSSPMRMEAQQRKTTFKLRCRAHNLFEAEEWTCPRHPQALRIALSNLNRTECLRRMEFDRCSTVPVLAKG
jgi:hypothetical protein